MNHFPPHWRQLGAIVLLMIAGCSTAPPVPDSPSGRHLELTYTVVLPTDLDPQKGPIHLWVPIPTDDGRQSVTLIERPLDAVRQGPDEHGNVFFGLVLVPEERQVTATDSAEEQTAAMDVELRFPEQRSWQWKYEVTRGVDHGGQDRGLRAFRSERIQEVYLEPNRNVPVSGRLAALATKAAEDKKEPFAVARALYDWVLDDMDYGTHEAGFGKGDSVWASKEHFGTSPDFDAYFISMARSLGIPARMHTGVVLPQDLGSGILKDLHTWTQFHVDDHGWIPVDLSAADLNPEKSEFYFGRLNADRITFTVGRDLVFDPAQESGALAFMLFALAEQAGKPFQVKTEIHYSDL